MKLLACLLLLLSSNAAQGARKKADTAPIAAAPPPVPPTLTRKVATLVEVGRAAVAARTEAVFGQPALALKNAVLAAAQKSPFHTVLSALATRLSVAAATPMVAEVSLLILLGITAAKPAPSKVVARTLLAIGALNYVTFSALMQAVAAALALALGAAHAALSHPAMLMGVALFANALYQLPRRVAPPGSRAAQPTTAAAAPAAKPALPAPEAVPAAAKPAEYAAAPTVSAPAAKPAPAPIGRLSGGSMPTGPKSGQGVATTPTNLKLAGPRAGFPAAK